MALALDISFRFGMNFREFISSINNASVTYEREDLLVDEKITNTALVRFNYSTSIVKFKNQLKREFSNSCDEIASLIIDITTKWEKLYIINRYFSELKSIEWMIIYHEGIGYKHTEFLFSNISKDSKYINDSLTEEYFQDYYLWMHNYLKKMILFLEETKKAIELLPYSDYPLPINLQPNPNISDVNKPIAFFDYLYLRNGIQSLKKDFIPKEEDYDHVDGLNYDEETEILSWYDQNHETGEWEEIRRTFKQKYLSTITSEFIKSRQFIDDHIYQLQNENDVKFFIVKLITILKHYLIIIQRSTDLKKYVDSPRPVKGLIKFLFEKYEKFVPLADAIITDIISKEKNTVINQENLPHLLVQAKVGTPTFSWQRNNPFTLSTQLWKQLIDHGLIDSKTDLEHFSKAFDGGMHEQSLNIKWTDKGKNKKTNKHTLFYMLNELAKADLIKEDSDNATFLRIVGFVFSDSNGEKLNNLKTSNITALKTKTKTSVKTQIDAIIRLLKQN